MTEDTQAGSRRTERGTAGEAGAADASVTRRDSLKLGGTLLAAATGVAAVPGGAAAAESEVTIGSATLDGTGATLELSVDSLPNGLSGFRLEVGVGNTGIATITGATVDGSFGMENTKTADDGSLATLEGVDTGENHGPGASDVSLGTVSVSGGESGETTLSVTITAFEDNGGREMDVATQDGTLTVPADDSSVSGGATISVGEATTVVGNTVEVPLVLTDAPTGVSGFRVEVALGDASVGSIADASVTDTFSGLSAVDVAADGATVTLEGVDTGRQVGPGASDVVLGRLVLSADEAGVTPITLVAHRYEDSEGTPTDVTVAEGALAVRDRPPQVGPNADGRPTDLDGDGLYEDVNGNGQLDYDDAVTLWQHQEEPVVTNNVRFFDYNGNGIPDYEDLIRIIETL